MESLIGIVIALVFAALSAVARSQAQRDQQQRRQARGQQWPGPVAGPGFPGYPRPQPVQPAQAPAPAPAPEPGGEGVGAEGPLSESTEAEVARFDRETAADINSAVEEVNQAVSEVAREAEAVASSNPTSLAIGQLGRDDYTPRTTPDESGELGFGPDELQKAVVMAEVLGRPKGARYFGRFRRL